jgi:[glutamine synthetase] adenylyltransferase / [glutamine synthetase]-adenylyl-L-tyrosine phosphorylase
MGQSHAVIADSIRAACWPLPAEAERARHGLERWTESAAAASPRLAEDGDARRLLDAVFGNSPFLTQCCLHEPAFLVELLHDGPDAAFDACLAQLDRDCRDLADRPSLMRALRQARRRAALAIAIADIGGLWPLERVTQALTGFADATIRLAVRHLLRATAATGAFTLPFPDEPERDSGLIVLGMGKLGAFELNYSSDVDLIILYDAERIRFTGQDSLQQCFARLAQDLVRILETRTADGYVFRTDLRLRPDPASTPPALSIRAALAYYESTGQNWERAAMIKARPVAGDRAAGAAFLRELRPFLWRKHLDFAAIRDIHSIKRQINAHRGGSRIAIAGHNLKLGRGGIREIEFFAQTQQLIWGGRMRELRVSGTCAALRALAASGRIDAAIVEELIAAYGFLRRTEHRLQMVEDAQTHSLPNDQAGLARIACFLGYPSPEAFAAELVHHLGRVEKRYAELFETAPSLSGPGSLVFTGTENDPETLATLARLGFAQPGDIATTLRGWHHGRYRAMRSQRARELLTELVPALLQAFAATAHPDFAFLRFDQFLGRLPAGVQLFSLFRSNPGLLELVADIMGTAPRLADELAQRPLLLDGVLAESFLGPFPDRAGLAAEFEHALAPAHDFTDVLDFSRRWTHDRRFQIGVNLLGNGIDGETAGACLADIADVAIAGLLPRVEAEFARTHGRVPGGAMAVIGLGKLGGREMTVTSDLDLIIIYDAPEAIEASDGPRPLPVSTYYARLSQRLINALTVLTPEGLLYEVDMRLRPSGNAGPIASSFRAFERYHDEMSWTWEHMALTRARPVAGPSALQDRIMAVIRRILTRQRDPDRLVLDVAEMRLRIASQHPPSSPWDLKHRRGGLIDVEFIAQYLELRAAVPHPEVLHPNTTAALDALTGAGALDPQRAEELIEAMRLWRRLQALLKLVVDDMLDEADAPEALKGALARTADAIDFARLKNDMSAAADRVRAHFAALIEVPAETARQNLEKEAQ